MSSTDHGGQTVSHGYYEEITALNRNARLKGIIPVGIYSGGLLTRINDTEITLSALVAEISDGTSQIRVKTASAATINDSTLDSGTISSSTPYIVLRWAYSAVVSNYMEIHAIASVSAAGANDIVVGKINFSGAVITGFSYSDRTFTKTHDMFLKPETYTGMYILLNAGIIHTDSGYVFVSTQAVGPFTAPSAPNSRIDLVYINDNGVPTILQGTAAASPVAPSYSGKLVIAEVTLANGDTSIAASEINDVRSFLTQRSATESSIDTSKLVKYNSGWFSIGLSTTYTKLHGLGSEPLIVLLEIAENADGSGRRTYANGSALFVHDNINVYAYGTAITEITASGIKIRTGIQSLVLIRDYNGVVWTPTTAYARIIALL